MDKHVAYSFLAGLNLGRYTNFMSNLIISSIVIYIYDRDVYSYETLNTCKNFLIDLIKN